MSVNSTLPRSSQFVRPHATRLSQPTEYASSEVSVLSAHKPGGKGHRLKKLI